MSVTTLSPARNRLYAFYAAHPDVENCDGEQLLALPAALLAELDALLAAAAAERDGELVIDQMTASTRTIARPTAGYIATARHSSKAYMPVLTGTVIAVRDDGRLVDLEGADLPDGKITAIRNWGAHFEPVYWWQGHIVSFELPAAAPLVIDPASGVREILPTFPGGMSDGVRVFTTGRNAKGRFATWDALRVTVTARGHWYRLGDVPDGLHNDTVCRGCGHHGHFNYILDYRLCTAPATAADVVAALSGPARHVQPGDRVRLEVSEYPDPVVGTIQRIYRDAIGSDVADVELSAGRIFPQNIEFLSAVL